MDKLKSRKLTAEGAAQTLTPKSLESAEEARRLIAEARTLHADHPERAFSLAEKAVTLARDCAEEHCLAECLLEVGISHRWLMRYEDAVTHLDHALCLSRRVSNPQIESHCLGEIALVCAYQADYVGQIENALLALSLARATEDQEKIGKLLQYVGVGYFELGDYAAALSYLLEGLAEAERAGRDAELSYVLHNIAGLYRIMGDAETGLGFSEKCLLAARRSKTTINEAGALCQISEYFSDRGEYERALERSREALDVARQITQTQPSAELNARQAQGKAYRGLGQWPEATACFQAALDIARSSHDQRHESIFLQELARVYQLQGRAEDARDALRQALAAAENTGARQHAYTAHRDLIWHCKQAEDLAGALAHAEAYHAIEREVLTAEAGNRTKALAVRMQVEQAKQETRLHQQDAELHRLRNIDLAEANHALEFANQKLQEQAELLQAQAEVLHSQADELERQAAQDGLTGLYNRRYLEAALARHFSQARRSHLPLAVAMIDIDHFKSINDRFGHQVGDEVLMTVAHLFQDSCRPSDLIARYGGEEFALAMPFTDLAAGLTVCERVRQAVYCHAWASIHPALAVTVSLGLSADTSAANHERLLGLADGHLYDAKHAGRNRVCAGEASGSLGRQ